MVQEIKSERALSAIREMVSAGQTTVIRNEREVDVNINDLVVGDLVELRHGQRVTADIRLVSCANLEIDGSLLTRKNSKAFECRDLQQNSAHPIYRQPDVCIAVDWNHFFRSHLLGLQVGD